MLKHGRQSKCQGGISRENCGTPAPMGRREEQQITRGRSWMMWVRKIQSPAFPQGVDELQALMMSFAVCKIHWEEIDANRHYDYTLLSESWEKNHRWLEQDMCIFVTRVSEACAWWRTGKSQTSAVPPTRTFRSSSPRAPYPSSCTHTWTL